MTTYHKVVKLRDLQDYMAYSAGQGLSVHSVYPMRRNVQGDEDNHEILCVMSDKLLGGGGSANGGLQAYEYDGSTDYFHGQRPCVNSSLSTTAITVSLWAQFLGGDGASQALFNITHSAGTRFWVAKSTANYIEGVFRDGGNTTKISDAGVVSPLTADATWHHIYMSANIASAGVLDWDFYIDGVDQGAATTLAVGSIACRSNLYWGIANNGYNHSAKANARISEIWAHTGLWMPWATYGAAFYNAGVPVDLGAGGINPLGGTGPNLVYLPKGGGTFNESANTDGLSSSPTTLTEVGTPTLVDGPGV